MALYSARRCLLSSLQSDHFDPQILNCLTLPESVDARSVDENDNENFLKMSNI